MLRKKHPTAVLLAISAVAAAPLLFGAAPAQASGSEKTSKRHVERKHRDTSLSFSISTRTSNQHGNRYVSNRRASNQHSNRYVSNRHAGNQHSNRYVSNRHAGNQHGNRYVSNRHARNRHHNRTRYSFTYNNRGHRNSHSSATIYYSTASDQHTSNCGGGYYKRTWIAPVYGTDYDNCGNPTTHIIHRGYYQNVWVPYTCGHGS